MSRSSTILFPVAPVETLGGESTSLGGTPSAKSGIHDMPLMILERNSLTVVGLASIPVRRKT
jgi:hypothetical protein